MCRICADDYSYPEVLIPPLLMATETPTPDLSALIDRVRMWNDSRKFGPHPEHGEIINFQVPPDEKTIDALLALSRWAMEAKKALEDMTYPPKHPYVQRAKFALKSFPQL